MMSRRRWLVAACACAASIVVLWLLRDPAWLASYDRGLFGVAVDESGREVRWTTSKASFYLPASASLIAFDVAGRLEAGVRVSIFVDGQRVARVLAYPEWQTIRVASASLPASSRRHRRVDIQVAQTWGPERFGVKIGWPVEVR